MDHEEHRVHRPERGVRSRPRKLEDCHNIFDLRDLARRALPGPIFHHLDGAAETEATALRNTSAFERETIIPRCLVDVSAVNTSTRVLGMNIEWPVICSPTGASRFFHPDGELAVARAVANARTAYCLSTVSTHSLEAVADASTGPKLFQLYIFRDREVTRQLIRRCKQAGYAGLCLTVDTPIVGKRERDLRTGWGVPIKISLRTLASFAAHPRWAWGQAVKGRISLLTVAELAGTRSIVTQTQYIGKQLDPTVTWKDVREFIDLWGGPFAIKGILSVDDARCAADAGATAVMVSNHGGRQLDGAASPIEVLPEIVQAVGDRVEIILDGGIRRGVHILKALARGAKACSIGRPYLYGLASGGEAGVSKALTLLRSELVRAMQLSGCTGVDSVNSSLLRPVKR